MLSYHNRGMQRAPMHSPLKLMLRVRFSKKRTFRIVRATPRYFFHVVMRRVG